MFLMVFYYTYRFVALSNFNYALCIIRGQIIPPSTTCYQNNCRDNLQGKLQCSIRQVYDNYYTRPICLSLYLICTQVSSEVTMNSVQL